MSFPAQIIEIVGSNDEISVVEIGGAQNIIEVIFTGPQGPEGPQGPQGPGGGSGGGGASMAISDAAPVEPYPHFWYRTTDAILFVRYDNSWVQVDTGAGAVGDSVFRVIEAPSDGTNTIITVLPDGRLSADAVVCGVSPTEIPPGEFAGGEWSRAQIFLPLASEAEGRMLWYSCPKDRQGASIHHQVVVSYPAAIGDIGLALGVLSYPFVLTNDNVSVWDFGGTEVTVTVPAATYADTAEMGAALIGALTGAIDGLQGASVDFDGYTVPQTEDEWYVAVTLEGDAGTTIEVVSSSNGDPIGLLGLTSVAAETSTDYVHGVDGEGRGGIYTHINRDTGPPHAAILMSDGTAWRWFGFPTDRSEMIGYAPTEEDDAFLGGGVDNVGLAIGRLIQKVMELEEGGVGGASEVIYTFLAFSGDRSLDDWDIAPVSLLFGTQFLVVTKTGITTHTGGTVSGTGANGAGVYTWSGSEWSRTPLVDGMNIRIRGYIEDGEASDERLFPAEGQFYNDLAQFGGTGSGFVFFGQSEGDDLVVQGSIGGSFGIETRLGPVHKLTMTSNTTLSLVSPWWYTANEQYSITVHVDGAYTLGWDSSVKWPGGVVPTYTTPATYVLTSIDGGITWRGAQIGAGYA